MFGCPSYYNVLHLRSKTYMGTFSIVYNQNKYLLLKKKVFKKTFFFFYPERRVYLASPILLFNGFIVNRTVRIELVVTNIHQNKRWFVPKVLCRNLYWKYCNLTSLTRVPQAYEMFYQTSLQNIKFSLHLNEAFGETETLSTKFE